LLRTIKSPPLRECGAGQFKQVPPSVDDRIYGVFFSNGGGGC
jgi:hypothetical protein